MDYIIPFTSDRRIIIRDHSARVDKYVYVIVKLDITTAPLGGPLPHRYDFDGVARSWKSSVINTGITREQVIGMYPSKDYTTFKFYLGYTDYWQFKGPVELSIDLENKLSGITIVVDGKYVKATPYVNDGGVWKPAAAYFKTPEGWKPTV